MTIPVYDITTLPAIIYPMTNEHEETTIYLGNRAVSGKIKAGLTIKARNDTATAALYDFWLTDCNYGLEPFLVPLPVFGRPTNDADPSLLVRFAGPLALSKDGQIWNGSSIKVDIIGTIDYVIDDFGNFIVSDLGEYTVADSDYVPTGNVINSYREVFYGG